MCESGVCVCVYAGRKKRGVSLKRFKNEFEIFDFCLTQMGSLLFPLCCFSFAFKKHLKVTLYIFNTNVIQNALLHNPRILPASLLHNLLAQTEIVFNKSSKRTELTK